jgi:hypothetical protein
VKTVERRGAHAQQKRHRASADDKRYRHDHRERGAQNEVEKGTEVDTDPYPAKRQTDDRRSRRVPSFREWVPMAGDPLDYLVIHINLR